MRGVLLLVLLSIAILLDALDPLQEEGTQQIRAKRQYGGWGWGYGWPGGWWRPWRWWRLWRPWRPWWGWG
ncbi:hypothetical protein QR680_016925 [Steinernema hermaphroditum]|uniref:Uncharacterized protein n=1 Tax=Steinernema hermaphroditum TaxID=289476 RepID=A0AA39HF62_9BILA|nr:hypothetical protein QR680_016925 [Steinernema hermaphroditum]